MKTEVPPHVKDLTGKEYHDLRVISYLGLCSAGKAIWKCRCVCNEIAIVRGQYLTSNRTKSCGCRRKRMCNQFNKERSTR
jgi:hypothetical protein